MSQDGFRLERLARLNRIGAALSSERDLTNLLEMILAAAKDLTNADGGTLYMLDGDVLNIEILMTDSLGLHVGGNGSNSAGLPPVPLHVKGERPDRCRVSAHAAVAKCTVNIPDIVKAKQYDFSGAWEFERVHGYRTVSLLATPLIDHEDRVIGVLQLVNARGADGFSVREFTREDQELLESLASQAGVALTNRRLIEDQKRLFEAFIEVIASAIDDKSPFTGSHCRRVPELTMMFAEATVAASGGPFADFSMSEDDLYALRIASWLHDCGKITTPEHVIDKSRKLETIFDRIALVDLRFEVLRYQLMQQLDGEALTRELQALDEEREFLRTANVGSEWMSEQDCERVRQIGQRQWTDPDGSQQPLLSEEETYNLTIPKGTLTTEERAIINGHMDTTLKMLEALPFPDYLRNVPEYAGGHHEKMDGTGYPKGLTREQMSVPARMMGIADIFEALTAQDRPYREPNKLSEALKILGNMKQNNHVDPELFDVFIREKVYLKYARQFLQPSQIDRVDESAIPGYGGS